MKIFTAIISLAIGTTIGVSAGLVAIDHQLDALTAKPVTTVSELPTKGQPTPNARQLTVYQVQGGLRTVRALQNNVQADRVQPPEGENLDNSQGNQEDADNLQPALGYGALNWSLQ